MDYSDILDPNRGPGMSSPKPQSASAYTKAWGLDIDPALVDAVASAESSNNPDAISPKGAQGLMQLMPDTAAEVAQKVGLKNYDLKNPGHSSILGATYLKDQLKNFGDDPRLALAAYNAGPGRLNEAIQAAGGARDFDTLAPHLPEETRNFVPRVMNRYAQLATHSNSLPPAQQPAAQAPAAAAEQQLPAEVDKAMSEVAAREQAYQMQQDAAIEGAVAGVKQAAETQAMQEMAADKQERDLQEHQKKQELLKAAIDAQETKYRTAQQEYIGAEIDPNRFWKEKSTGEKILAAIAVGLGAMGAAMTGGGRNQALDIIQRAIDRDLYAQKAELDKRGAVATQERGLYQDMLERYKNEDDAFSAAQALSRDLVKQKIETLTKGLKSEESIAAAKALYGQLEVQKQEALAKIGERLAKDPERQAQVAQRARGNVLAQLEQNASRVDVSRLTKEDRERFVPGLGFAASTQDKKEIVASQRAFKDLARTLDDMIKDREEYGVEFLDRTVVATQRARAAKALLQLKELYKLGALDKGAVEVGAQIIPQDPTKIGFILPQLKELRSSIESGYTDAIQARITEGAGRDFTRSKDINIGKGVAGGQ